MGVLKNITNEYFGETVREEDIIELPKGVEFTDFTDRNGTRHRKGYHIVDGDGSNMRVVLEELIDRIMELHGTECDLNCIDVSNIESMGWLFMNSKFNGDVSGWDVSKVKFMQSMFYASKFEGDLSNWNVKKNCEMYGIFTRSPLEFNPPEWCVGTSPNYHRKK